MGVRGSNSIKTKPGKGTSRKSITLEGLLSAIPDAALITNPAGRIELVNRKTEELFGYQANELLGKPVENLIPERFRDRHAQHRLAYTMAAATRIMGAGLKLFGRRKDGREFPAEIALGAIPMAEGVYSCAIVRDVTHKVATQQALEESERTFQAVFDWAGIGIVVVDEESRIILANPKFYRLLDFSNTELVGRSVLDFLHPEDGARTQPLRSDLLAGKRRAYQAEVRLRRSDGKFVWANVTVTGVRRADGTFLYSIGMVEDITIRRRAEQELRKSEFKYRDLFEGAYDIIFLLDPKGRPIDVNQRAQRLTGYSRVELLDMNFLQEVVHPADRPRIQSMLRNLALGRDDFYQVRLRTKGGELLYFEGASTPRRTSQGEILYSRCILRDISERKKLESRLEQTQRLESLAVLSGGIAHDFNNLLMAILGNASLGKMESSPESSLNRFFDEIESSALRAAELTRRILSFAGEGFSEPRLLDLNQILEELVRPFGHANQNRIRLEFRPGADLPLIRVDFSQIRHVWNALLENALEAYQDGASGTVEVSTGVVKADANYLTDTSGFSDAAPGRYVFFEVTDEGAGIDTDTLQRMFDPFFSTKFKGRGLGLASTLGIVRSLRGVIKVESRPGRGTRVTVLLPPAAEEEEI